MNPIFMGSEGRVIHTVYSLQCSPRAKPVQASRPWQVLERTLASSDEWGNPQWNSETFFVDNKRRSDTFVAAA